MISWQLQLISSLAWLIQTASTICKAAVLEKMGKRISIIRRPHGLQSGSSRGYVESRSDAPREFGPPLTTTARKSHLLRCSERRERPALSLPGSNTHGSEDSTGILKDCVAHARPRKATSAGAMTHDIQDKTSLWPTWLLYDLSSVNTFNTPP